MSSGIDSWHDHLKEQAYYERENKIKDSGLPRKVYLAIEDLESLTNNYPDQYSYKFGLKLRAIVNSLRENL